MALTKWSASVQVGFFDSRRYYPELREVVEQLLSNDLQLNDQNHVPIKEHWKALYKDQWGWNRIS